MRWALFDMNGTLLDPAGIGEPLGLSDARVPRRLELVVGSDETGAFKPHPQVYARGVERTGAPTGEVCMIATHGWDLLGAHRAGMRTAWVRRKELVRYPANPSPDAEGDGLLEIAEGIARLGDHPDAL